MLGDLKRQAAPQLPLQPQRPPRLQAHHARRPNQVAARLRRPVAAPADRRGLLGLEPVGQHLRQVAHRAAGVLDHAGPLAGRQRVDAAAPAIDEELPELGDELDRDALDQEVQVQGPAALELDLDEPLDGRPALPSGSQELRQVPPALGSAQVLAGRQDDPQRRRVLHGVEGQHLDGLDHVERLAVPAEVRGAAPSPDELAALVVHDPEVLGPPPAPRAGQGVVNSLMQVKGRLRRPGLSRAGSHGAGQSRGLQARRPGDRSGAARRPAPRGRSAVPGRRARPQRGARRECQSASDQRRSGT